ncbi:MAG: HD domain-containing protein, partial [Desulfatiglandales bacterium]
DRDLLLVAALLHDVGKVRELKWRPYSIDYTDEGRLIGHIVLGIQILGDLLKKIPDFPETLHTTLQHIILSHHGQLEFGSPKRPKTLEAVALNLIDDLDAKLNGIKSFIEGDTTEGHWTEYNRLLSRFFLKGPLVRGDVPNEMIP